jgi:hypothetical protein
VPTEEIAASFPGHPLPVWFCVRRDPIPEPSILPTGHLCLGVTQSPPVGMTLLSSASFSFPFCVDMVDKTHTSGHLSQVHSSRVLWIKAGPELSVTLHIKSIFGAQIMNI